MSRSHVDSMVGAMVERLALSVTGHGLWNTVHKLHTIKNVEFMEVREIWKPKSFDFINAIGNKTCNETRSLKGK